MRKAPHSCQFCGKDLRAGVLYHKRYRICPEHMLASCLEVDGCPQRFCQLCGRFHMLAEFEGNKRSCRDQLRKHALRRRLSRRAAAGQAPKQSDSPSGCGSGSSGTERTGGQVLLQQMVQAQQVFAAVKARAEAAAAAPVPPPWLASSLMSQPTAACEQTGAPSLPPQPPQLQQRQQQQAGRSQLLPAQALPAQQQPLEAYGSDHSSHSMPALARAASVGTAAALPSPVAPNTPASAEDVAAPPLQQLAAALLPALNQPSLALLLQAVMASAPVAAQPQLLSPLAPQLQPALQQLLLQLHMFPESSWPPQQQPVPLLPRAQPPPPQLLCQAAQPGAPVPFAHQLLGQVLAAHQQQHVAQQQAQCSEDELLRILVHIVTALSGAAHTPQSA